MDYRIEMVPAFAVSGIRNLVVTEDAFSIVPGIWAEAQKNGFFEKLWAIRKSDHKIRGILGVCIGGQWGRKDEFDYMLAIVSDAAVPNDMTNLAFSEATWAVFDVPGSPEGMTEAWKRMYTEWLPFSTYELGDLPAIENYLPPEENRNELWISVVKIVNIVGFICIERLPSLLRAWQPPFLFSNIRRKWYNRRSCDNGIIGIIDIRYLSQ
jgi:AraC family transcriptional regulator